MIRMRHMPVGLPVVLTIDSAHDFNKVWLGKGDSALWECSASLVTPAGHHDQQSSDSPSSHARPLECVARCTCSKNQFTLASELVEPTVTLHTPESRADVHKRETQSTMLV